MPIDLTNEAKQKLRERDEAISAYSLPQTRPTYERSWKPA